MRDRECINRFCGFYLLGRQNYRGDMDAMLGETLQSMNKMNEQKLTELRGRFDTSMRNNYEVFERHAFRKHIANSETRSVINVALFDVFSVLFAGVNEEVVKANATAIRENFFTLMNDPNFQYAISYSTNSTRQVNTRFELVNGLMKDLISNVDAPTS
jgi:hypothetical protein